MTRSLKLYVAGLVLVSTVLLTVTSFAFAPDPRIGLDLDGQMPAAAGEIGLGIAFWTLLCLFASALPVRMPRGMLVAVSTAPILAAASLGGPMVAGWVALLGTTELREVRGQIPWYGTLTNHAVIVIAAITGAVVMDFVGRGAEPPIFDLFALVVGAATMFVLNVILVSQLLALRHGHPFREMLLSDARGFAASLLALSPLSWLMARMYSEQGAGWWATLLFALPLYTTRLAYHQFVEMREMFTQTIGALAGAVDKRDPFTSRHSHNVKNIAADIGRAMRLSSAELEALEWGGLLHDVGKIGVPDAVLLKQERLNREERMVMNAHPVLGAEIIAPVTRLAAELPIIRHHHEWYNGSGYPDRLIGDEIPKLARILHVADAFEAMTAQRPYRMTPLTAEQAVGELRKFAGIQFDPVVVDAFVRTHHADGVADPGRTVQPRPIPLITQAANRMSAPGATPSPPGGH